MVFEIVVAFSIAMIETVAPVRSQRLRCWDFRRSARGSCSSARHSEPTGRQAGPCARGGDDLAARVLDQRDAVRLRHRVVAADVDLAGDELSVRDARPTCVGRSDCTARRASRTPRRAREPRQLSAAVADRRRRHGRGLAREPQDAGAPGGDQAREARTPAGRRCSRSAFTARPTPSPGCSRRTRSISTTSATTREGRLYYVMELLDGISLQTLVTTFGPQPRVARGRDSPPDLPLARGSAPARGSCTAISSRRT